jgi:hypothetical protein
VPGDELAEANIVVQAKGKNDCRNASRVFNEAQFRPLSSHAYGSETNFNGMCLVDIAVRPYHAPVCEQQQPFVC